MKLINWNIFKFWKPQPQRIDDLDKAVDTLIEAAQYIVPEKRFAALKVAVEMLYKDNAVYEKRTRKPKNADPEIEIRPDPRTFNIGSIMVVDDACSTCMPEHGKHEANCLHHSRSTTDQMLPSQAVEPFK